ncbi:MAG TPA: hypothetical protein VMV00_01335 [Candidatus Baltobacteraceae bacterium]|nr:hypothetical protein [Candidatus Baltobacteraceae bacterium]
MPNKIALFRLSLAIFAVVAAAAHIFSSPSDSMLGQFWFNVEVVVYAVLAAAFILGLRRWYVLAVAFSALNMALFLLAGFAAVPGVTTAPLAANLDFSHYDVSRLFSVLSYVYIILAGLVLMLYDKGSKLEKLY